MKRRTFIAAIAATPLATSASAAAVDPIVSSQRNYLAARHAFEALPTHMCGSVVEEDYYELSWDCSKQIYSKVPVTMDGLISQLEHYRHQFMDTGTWGDEMDIQLIDNAIRGAKALGRTL